MKKLLALLCLLLVMTSCGNNSGEKPAAGSDKPATQDAKQPEAKPEAKPEEKPASTTGFKDGTFDTKATIKDGYADLKVVVEGGKLKSVDVVKREGKDEDKPFFEQASAVLKTMVEKQSAKVDAVAGATLSSNALMEAVSKVLVENK